MIPGLIVPAGIAVLLYLVGAALWARGMSRPDGPAALRTRIAAPAAAALVIHGFLLHQSLFTAAGLNLGFFNALSLVTWCAALLVTAGIFLRPVENLVVIFFPAAALGIVLDLLLTSDRVVAAGVAPGVRAHIALSIIAYTLLAIAAAQAVIVALQERWLRRRQPVQAMRLLPPLQTMEDLLVQMLTAGFFFLTLSLATGFMFVDDLLSQHLAHKTVFSVLAWLVFAIVLGGRWARGWRGQRLVRLTLGGFVLLLLAYFGSKFVLELVLHRI
jgi:ABC-type uncharacterized transport system permease subunit